MSQLNASPLGLTLDSLGSSSGVAGYGDGVEIPSRFNSPNSNTIVFTPWPDGSMDDKGKPYKRRTIHSNDIYNVSLKNIIDTSDSLFTVDKSGNTVFPTKLKAVDFAYLKNVGVFPNNRLMVARRYPSPVVDDPTAIKQSPISTMISWVPDGEDFIKFDFGEGWEDAEADFTEVFNSVGKDVMGKAGSTLGGYLGGGGGAIPLPGFSEGLQRKLMKKLGLAGEGSDDYIPSGEPNIIKQAKIRKLIGYGKAGSSLDATITIKMVCEWEQKFLAGIDPSVAWMDIMNTVLKFGTSTSKFYLGKGGGSNVGATKKFIEGLSNKPLETLQSVLNDLVTDIGEIIDTIAKALNGVDEKKDDKSGKLETGDLKQKLSNGISSVISTISEKYQVRLLGIISSLTGNASTPWHITLGNPMRPIFCSGDMLVEKVEVTLGSELAFNDLPSTIKAEFTLKNARPLGMDEILAKFNVGYMRTVTVKKDLYTSRKDSDFIPPDDQINPKFGTQSVPSTSIAGTNFTNASFPQTNGVSNLESGSPGTGVSGTGNSGESRVGNGSVTSDIVNSNAHSTNVLSSEQNISSLTANNNNNNTLESQINSAG